MPNAGTGQHGFDGQEGAEKEFDRAMHLYSYAAGAGVVFAVTSFAWAVADDLHEFFRVLASGLGITAAAAVVGALLGFLFGIPRTLQRESGPTEDGPLYLANTNLEQISDWLTKILVGIGLVQIGRAPAALSDLADTLASMLGDEAGSGGFGLTLCIFAAIFSFLLTYLWTRVRLKRQLQLADRDVVEAANAVFAERSSADADALSLVERQLSGQNPPTEAELIAALGQASKSTLVLIYQRAEDTRFRTWWKPDGRSEHERTIPVFRALIANDPDQRFHRHFGSLGFALKDTDPPDCPGAVDALTTAIRIRGPVEDRGFAIYEWNRAACRILMAGSAGPSAAASAEIEADLRAAASQLPPRFFQPSIAGDPSIDAVASWMATRNLTYESLSSPSRAAPSTRKRKTVPGRPRG